MSRAIGDAGEAAFVWKNDGSTELYLPGISDGDDEDDMESESPHFQAISIACLYEDSPKAAEIRERVAELLADSAEEVESETDIIKH